MRDDEAVARFGSACLRPEAVGIHDNPIIVVPERCHDTRDTPRSELLALLRLVETAQKELARLMRSRRRWVGKILNATTPRELDALKSEHVQLREELVLAERQLKERTDDLVAAVARTRVHG